MNFSFPHKYLSKEISPKRAALKKSLGLCRHHGCSSPHREGALDCEKCKSRKLRLRNPKKYIFTQVRASAAKRKIPFLLSFEEFLEFDAETGYCANVGRKPDSATIDRIHSHLPYEKGNLRLLPWEDNCAKKIEGMTESWEPIAKALFLARGGDPDTTSWRSFRKLAEEIVGQQEAIARSILPEGSLEDQLPECPF